MDWQETPEQPEARLLVRPEAAAGCQCQARAWAASDLARRASLTGLRVPLAVPLAAAAGPWWRRPAGRCVRRPVIPSTRSLETDCILGVTTIIMAIAIRVTIMIMVAEEFKLDFCQHSYGPDRCQIIKPIIFFSPTKFAFSTTLLLFRQVGSLFCQVGSLFRQSLRSQVSGSPLESRPSDRTASFCVRNLKLLSLSAQLERNAWQKLAAVSSGGTSLVTAPFSSC